MTKKRTKIKKARNRSIDYHMPSDLEIMIEEITKSKLENNSKIFF